MHGFTSRVWSTLFELLAKVLIPCFQFTACIALLGLAFQFRNVLVVILSLLQREPMTVLLPGVRAEKTKEVYCVVMWVEALELQSLREWVPLYRMGKLQRYIIARFVLWIISQQCTFIKRSRDQILEVDEPGTILAEPLNIDLPGSMEEPVHLYRLQGKSIHSCRASCFFTAGYGHTLSRRAFDGPYRRTN